MLAALILALALAADAFAAALAQGAGARGSPHAAAFVIGAAFGLAQAVMPLLGWALGSALGAAFAAVDHWIAFVILAALSLKLIKEGSERRMDRTPQPGGAWVLLTLALATSIDAAAAGVTFEALGLTPFFTAAVVGGVTALACAGGVYLGRAMGVALGKPAELAGGAILMLLGVKVLWDHGAIPGSS